MRPTLLRAFEIGTFIGLIAPVHAQDASGDVASGRRIAETWCISCHQIDTDELAPLPNPPSFAEIANLPSTTALSLNVFLRTSHKAMPNYQLSREEIDDVVAFILNLKNKNSP